MFAVSSAPRNQKYVLPSTASQSTRSCRIKPPCTHRSPIGLARNFFAGSAAGTLVMPRLKSNPNARQCQKDESRPYLVCLEKDRPAMRRRLRRRSPPETSRVRVRRCPRRAAARAAIPAAIHTSQGPKSAACVLARNTAAISRFRFCQPSPAMASTITAISNNLVPMVTVRLL